MRTPFYQVVIAIAVYFGQTSVTVRVNRRYIICGTLFCLAWLCFLAVIHCRCKLHQLIPTSGVLALVIFRVFPFFRLILTGVVSAISAC